MKKQLLLILFFLQTISVFTNPLHDAVKKGDHVLLKQLLVTGKHDIYESAEIDGSGDKLSPFEIAIEKSNIDCVKVFLALEDFKVDYRVVGKPTPLQAAAECGHSAIVTLLIAAGADVCAKGRPLEPDMTALAYDSEMGTVFWC